MFIENKSKLAFSETVTTLTGVIELKGWKVLATHNLKETLDKHGYNVLPVVVFELCNPRFSSRMLAGDDERTMASMMPCRIAVYEKSDGSTYISRMNAEMFAAMLGGLAAEVMTEAFRETEVMVAELV